MTPVKGDFSKIYLREFGSTSAVGIVGCTTGDTLNLNTEMLEVTGPAANFVEVLPTYNSGTLTADSVLITTENGDPQIASDVIVNWQKNRQKLEFIYEWTDGITDFQITGTAYISALSINGAAQDFAAVQIELQISGQWDTNF